MAGPHRSREHPRRLDRLLPELIEAPYSLAFKKAVTKGLRSIPIPNQDVKRILKRIDSLCENPRAEGSVKLSGQERYRVRQGVYRIVYEIQDAELIVLVVKVAHRSEVYKSS